MRQRSVLPHIVVHPCLCLFALCPMKSQYSDRLYAATSCAARGPPAWRRRLTRKSSCVMLAHVSCLGQQIGACDGGGSRNPLETASELAGEHVGICARLTRESLCCTPHVPQKGGWRETARQHSHFFAFGVELGTSWGSGRGVSEAAEACGRV